MTVKLPKFLEKGLRFECQGTGRCCITPNQEGYVYFNIHDRRRIAKHLGINTLQFTRRFCQKIKGLFCLKGCNEACIFLEGKRCGVYEARPTQCRTFPFWPENMSAKGWSELTSMCAGIGKGKLYSPEHIQAVLALESQSLDQG